MALITEEDTTDAMAECFVEEFLRLGFSPDRILGLFRDPFYLGPNLALQHRGEPHIRQLISATFARWGRPVVWPDDAQGGSRSPAPPVEDPGPKSQPTGKDPRSP